MPANEYEIGDIVRLEAEFRVGGALTNTTAVFKVKRPDGTTDTPATVADSTGVYHADYTPTQHGIYYWRVAGTGSAVAAAEGAFVVKHSRFV